MCGTSLTDFRVTVEILENRTWKETPPHFLYQKCPKRVRVKLAHVGAGRGVELKAEHFFSSPNWLHPNFDWEQKKIGPGESLTFPLKLSLPLCPELSETVRFGFRELLESGLLFSVSPELELRGPIEPLTLRERGDTRLFAQLYCHQGAASLESMVCEVEGLDLVSRDRDSVRPGQPANLELRISCQLAATLLGSGAKCLDVSFLLPVAGRILGQVFIQAAARPTLRAAPSGPRMELMAVQGMENRHKITIGNGFLGQEGLADWRCQSIEIDSQNEVELRLKSPELPLRLESGQEVSFVFELVSGAETVSGTLRFLGEPIVEQMWFLNRPEPGLFEGWLLADFGTRGSCLSLYSPELGVSEPVIHDSAVLYERFRPRKGYLVGEQARAGLDRRESCRAVLTSFKVDLMMGARDYQVVPTFEPLKTYPVSPAQAAVDFLARLIREKQEQLRERGRADLEFGRVLYCYPARTSIEQRKCLERTLVEALAQCRSRPRALELFGVPEPVAASLFFIEEARLWEQLEPETGRTVLVYDLGGGTLDLCLLRLTLTRKGALVWKILGVDGKSEIGGEAIVSACQEYLRELCCKYLPAGATWLPNSDPDFVAEQHHLHQLAERAVVRWCEGGDEEIALGSLALTCLRNGRAEEIGVESLQMKLVNASQATHSLVEEGVATASAFLQRHQVPQPNLILKIGRGAAYPPVEQQLLSTFSESRIVSPSRPKTCVVLGAARHSRILSGDGITLSTRKRPVVTGAPLDHYILLGAVGLKASPEEGGFLEFFPLGTVFGEGSEIREERDDLLLFEGQSLRVLQRVEDARPGTQSRFRELGSVELPAGLEGGEVSVTLTVGPAGLVLSLVGVDRKLELMRVPTPRFAAEI